ncbi:MAG: cation diffusion facilitator family transporter [bacterium]|jgi:cation diffusion facilitator family transporter
MIDAYNPGMEMSAPEKAEYTTERRGLLISAVTCLVVGCVAFVFVYLSSSQAILLDGVFNIIYFLTGLFTLRIARLLREPGDEEFPFGFAYFEPLINGVKGALVLGMSLIALAGAAEAAASGGREIEAGAAVGYAVFATVACWSAFLGVRHVSKRTNSPLLRADAANWMVNGAVSTAVLLAFLSMYLIHALGADHLLPYVDPVLVIALVVVTISVPARQAWRALMEMLNRAPSVKVRERIKAVVESCIRDLPVEQVFVRVVQPGRMRYVSAHVVLPRDFEPAGLLAQDEIRERIWDALQKDMPGTILDVVFTADARWDPDADQLKR